jgi:hypothetical protein
MSSVHRPEFARSRQGVGHPAWLLVVEDEAAIAVPLGEGLERAGFDVRVVGTALDADAPNSPPSDFASRPEIQEAERNRQ